VNLGIDVLHVAFKNILNLEGAHEFRNRFVAEVFRGRRCNHRKMRRIEAAELRDDFIREAFGKIILTLVARRRFERTYEEAASRIHMSGSSLMNGNFWNQVS